MRGKTLTLWLTGVLLALLCLLPRPALAIEYEVFIDVDDEDDLNELLASDQISEDTFNTLIELRRRGVDLNEASREELYSLPNLTYEDVDRILAYRAEAGIIHAPADLAAAGVLDLRTLGSILTFIRAGDPEARLTATHGWVRYQTAWSTQDRGVPPMVMQARVTTLRQLTIGAAGFVTRQRPGPPVWDPNRDALMAEQMKPRVNLPKAFVQWDGDKFGVIVGSYRAGFGQRLIFDTTNRYTPNGFYFDDAVYRPNQLGQICRESAGELPESPCAGDLGNTYGIKDFRWRDSQRGVA
ncbi:MAG: helix-hairpin-helix domain-containing protein, partial [Myxococcales bacterium]|nr:helix-hairpin-helix domain-containing protein [Myxococcales bacterium]